MSQQVQSGKPESHTPLHIICNGSDAGFDNWAIIKALIDNRIVDSYAFASQRTNKVTVLFSFSWASFSNTANQSGDKCPEGRGAKG